MCSLCDVATFLPHCRLHLQLQRISSLHTSLPSTFFLLNEVYAMPRTRFFFDITLCQSSSFRILFPVCFLSLGLYFGLRSPSCCHHMGSPQIHRFVKCAHYNQSFYVYSTEIPYILHMHRILLLCIHCTFSTNFSVAWYIFTSTVIYVSIASYFHTRVHYFLPC